jgi:hypothetical protein
MVGKRFVFEKKLSGSRTRKLHVMAGLDPAIHA